MSEKKKTINERAELEKVRKAMKTIKVALGRIEQVNRDADRFQAANAAYKWQQKMGVFHAEATEDLFEHWPEEVSGEIVALGGGGR